MPGTLRDSTKGLRLSIKGLEARIVAGVNIGQSASVPKGDCLRIGRGVDNDLRIDDDSVSKRHCEIRAIPNGWVLQDRSTNGTRVNGVRIREVFIDGTTTIDIGSSRVQLQLVVTPRDSEDIARPPEIIGESSVMLRLFDRIQRVAVTDLTVLLAGETGTGKELVARELHRLREAAGRASTFVVVDCTNIPTSLAESMLQGHKRGAFTGAVTDRMSPFEAAHGGTIFLDEVGDLPQELQGKLLRILQEREICRIGSNTSTPVDVRVVSATHRDLPALVERGEFREDLYYRLCESTLAVPSLRSRGDDIMVLAEAFLTEQDSSKRFDDAARQSLTTARWPGNIRQLRAVVRRAAALNPDKRCITASDLFDATQPIIGDEPMPLLSGLLDQPWDLAREAFARAYWAHACQSSQESIAEIAARTQVSTVAVRSRKKQFGFE